MKLKRILSLNDPTSIALLISNLLTILFTILFNWSPAGVIWGFFVQSTLIGIFIFLKMCFIEHKFRHDLELEYSQQKTKPPKNQITLETSTFFAVWYGGIHLISAFFIANFFPPTQSDFETIGTIGLIFLANHLFSFIYFSLNMQKPEIPLIKWLEKIFSESIPRVSTILITLFFGQLIASFIANDSLKMAFVIFFLLIKTIFDLKGHAEMHQEELKLQRFLKKQRTIS